MSTDKYLSTYNDSKQGLWLGNGMAVLTHQMVENFESNVAQMLSTLSQTCIRLLLLWITVEEKRKNLLNL